MRAIKFRAWDIKRKVMLDNILDEVDPVGFFNTNFYIPLEYTGLNGKNGDKEVYECDIIDTDGNVIGNQYETPALLKEKTNLLIQGFGTKDWLTTYTQAVERGCHDA